MTTENSSADALTILARIIELDDGKMRMAHKPHPERSQEWKAYAAGLPKLLSQARAILAALPVEQPVAAPKFDKQKMLASAREHGMDLGDNPVAYEFYNKATGHAVVDYTRWTHRGHLTEKDGYEARPLVYAHAARAQPAPSPADERAAEAMAIPYGHEFADTIQCQAHSGPDCTECGGTGVWSAQADARVGLTFDKWWSVGGWRLVSQAGDKNGWRGAAEAGYEAGYIGGLFAAAAAVTKPEPRAEVTHGDTTMDECMATLLDRMEAAELDAARYRYLRERPLDAVSVGGVFAGKTPDNVVLNGADLDAAIDAARTGASS